MKPYQHPRVNRRVAIRVSGLQSARSGRTAPVDTDGSAPMGVSTIKYVADLANDSFKRQVELDESVWRSLPFFAATFAFVAAVTGKAALDAPTFSGSAFSIIANAFFTLAIGSLAWALRWFWTVLRTREYEIPADDAAVRLYAEQMTTYHHQLGLSGTDLDDKVVEELRLFMIEQYGSAARTNFTHNTARLTARSRVLLFMLAGFVLAFLCEATIFIHRDLYGPSEVHGEANQRDGTEQGQPFGAVHANQADSAEVPPGDGRRELLGRQLKAEGAGEALMPKTPPIRPTSAVTPTRPTPPAPQVVMKDHGLRAGVRPPPKPTPSKK